MPRPISYAVFCLKKKKTKAMKNVSLEQSISRPPDTNDGDRDTAVLCILLNDTFLFTSFSFFNDTPTTEIYTLSLHDALPIFFLILKSGVNHTSRGSISTSTLPSIKLRKCSSKIITSILSFISGRLATKSNQIKQLIRNGRSASLQRTFKKSFTSFSHST